MQQKVQLLEKNGRLFEEIAIPDRRFIGITPEAILSAVRVFLPAGKGKYKECAFYLVPLPPVAALNLWFVGDSAHQAQTQAPPAARLEKESSAIMATPFITGVLIGPRHEPLYTSPLYRSCFQFAFVTA